MNGNDEAENTRNHPPEGAEYRGPVTDALITVGESVLSGAAGGAAGTLAAKLLNRPPQEQPKQVELPPGVKAD